MHFQADLPRNLPSNFFNGLRFDRIMVMILWPRFFGLPCIFRVLMKTDRMYPGSTGNTDESIFGGSAGSTSVTSVTIAMLYLPCGTAESKRQAAGVMPTFRALRLLHNE